jgi:hypothetical protein
MDGYCYETGVMKNVARRMTVFTRRKIIGKHNQNISGIKKKEA